MVNIDKLLKQARQMQEDISRQMEELEVDCSAGGDAVRIRMNGKKEVLAVSIAPEAVGPGDPSILEDLVLAAVNETVHAVDKELAGTLGGAMPPGFVPD